MPPIGPLRPSGVSASAQMPTGQPDCSPPQTRALRRVETGPFRAQPSLARPLTAGEAGPGIILVGTIAVRPSRRPARPRQTQATEHKQDRLGLARVGPARVQSLGGQKSWEAAAGPLLQQQKPLTPPTTP